MGKSNGQIRRYDYKNVEVEFWDTNVFLHKFSKYLRGLKRRKIIVITTGVIDELDCISKYSKNGVKRTAKKVINFLEKYFKGEQKLPAGCCFCLNTGNPKELSETVDDQIIRAAHREAQKYLEDRKVSVATLDRALSLKAIAFGVGSDYLPREKDKCSIKKKRCAHRQDFRALVGART